MNRFEDSYAMYVNSRQQQQPSNDVILRFLNYCATIIQKHVKGYQHRERHKIIMMRIRRFKQLLNAFISGYKIRKILKLSEINGIIFDIQETDDGTYGNPITEKKKTRLIQRINQLFITGSYTQNRKQSKSSKNLKQINNNLPFQNQNKQEDYSQIKKQQNDMPIRSKGQYDQNPEQGSGTNRNFDERPTNNKKYNQSESQQNLKQRKFNAQDDDNPIQARGQYQFNEPNKQSFEELPIRSKGQYQFEEQPINPKGQQVNQYDEQPIKSKGQYANQYDEKPTAKGSYSNPYDEQPIGGRNKGQKHNQFDEQPIGGQGSYSNPYDEQPIQSKGGYSNQYEDKPLTSKGQYDYEEPQEEKPKPKPKAKPKKKVVNEDIKQEQEYDDIKQPEKYDNEFQASEDQPKKKKQDPKAIENLKKRTKYDPRKAIQEAKKKDGRIIINGITSKTPPKQKKPQQPQQKTPVKQVQVKQEVKPEIEIEVVQDSEDQLNQPKNFLKRKSKKVPLNNPKQEPKTVKSKVNCWTQNEDVEVEQTDDTHLSPKGYMQTRSPSKRFEQQQTIQQSQIPIIRQQIQIQQNQQQQQQQQKGVKKISIEELEKTYNTNYTQKYSTTMSQLQQLNQQRLVGSAAVPIITVRSRFYATFRLSEFENLLQILEDQYIRLSSK
ncbi:hypothetical protein pb186bvf_014618 [Paramecium bursaria]